MSSFSDKIYTFITETMEATSFEEIEVIQTLWSGYGKIKRLQVTGCNENTVVVKHIQLNDTVTHPRGWNTNISHLRKTKSYQVECDWYQNWSDKCSQLCRVPKCYGFLEKEGETLIILEDIDSAGFPLRLHNINQTRFHACIRWLANFHATFLYSKPQKLWPIGTYWHLDTRPDEFAALDDLALKNAARAINDTLNASPFKTIVHGDAKIANFCFAENENDVAAVDFQYTGGGVGVKDLAYFVGSCLGEREAERQENDILEYYFQQLEIALQEKISPATFKRLQKNWHELYYFAWADFHRFLKGWNPGHWKINGYSERITKTVIDSLN